MASLEGTLQAKASMLTELERQLEASPLPTLISACDSTSN